MFDSKKIRREILTMAFNAQAIHIGPAFSVVEIFSVLYRSFDKNENRIILSKGHGVMTQYICLAEKNCLDKKHLQNYLKDGSSLKALADSSIKGIDVTSGSLGHGLSIAVGMSLAAKLNSSLAKTFCIIGDGEANEGSIWEAIMFAAHFKLENLMIIIDVNNFQALGETKNIINTISFKEKFISFGFDALEVNGHNEDEIEKAINKLFSFNKGNPKVIIANTIKGRGISFMENNNDWHYNRLNKDLYDSAMAELS